MVAEKIRSLVADAVGDALFTVERPSQAEHGDFATNAALVVAKQQGKAPREVAADFQKKLSDEFLFSKVDVAGPGFLNFTIAPQAWQESLQDILESGERYGTFPSTGKKIQVEFISANPTGPLTLGNGRGGFGGDVLARVLARAGNSVEREYYINDAGNQFLALGKTLKGEEKLYAGDYIKELAQKIDTGKPVNEVGHQAVELLMVDIKKTIKHMGISYDTWFSEEQQLHQTGEVEKIFQDLVDTGATYEKEGAVWLKTTEYGDDKDRVIKKSDGSYTYVMPDIAYHRNKLLVRKLDKVINIWGADHHGDVKRLQIGVELVRKKEPFNGELVIILTQLVRLVQGGKEVKMSKRAGTYVALDDLLEEIPADVARFFFVMKSFDTHMDFDMDLAKEQSQKNPVYYLKYAHARIAGILDKASASQTADLSKLDEPAELALIKELGEFPALIQETAGDYQIHRIPHYALGLADAFHKFYEQCRVISDDAELTAARVQLVRGTQIVLKNIGETLGIDMPENM